MDHHHFPAIKAAFTPIIANVGIYTSHVSPCKHEMTGLDINQREPGNILVTE